MEAKLRGPHSFPLERLLHIFFAIYADHDADDEDEGGQYAEEVRMPGAAGNWPGGFCGAAWINGQKAVAPCV